MTRDDNDDDVYALDCHHCNPVLGLGVRLHHYEFSTNRHQTIIEDEKLCGRYAHVVDDGHGRRYALASWFSCGSRYTHEIGW